LQNESGVIHIVAEHMEDLTKLLSHLVENELKAEHANVSDLPNVKGHPRSGSSLVTMLKHDAEFASVMPKGRNFH
jgi:hypothetical protein